MKIYLRRNLIKIMVGGWDNRKIEKKTTATVKEEEEEEAEKDCQTFRESRENRNILVHGLVHKTENPFAIIHTQRQHARTLTRTKQQSKTRVT